MERFGLVIALLIGLAPSLAIGEDVQVDASMDSAILDVETNNNMGASTWGAAGVTNMSEERRALFLMNIGGAIPAGATIENVTFQFDVTQQGGMFGQAGVNFGLFSVASAWTEGTGIGNAGSPTGDGATWNTSNGVDSWTPGGDFAAISSGSVFVDWAADGGSVQTYSLGNAQLIADVQNMLDNPGSNFGFELLPLANVPGSAMRITSREERTSREGTNGAAARLIITYSTAIDVTVDQFNILRGFKLGGDINSLTNSDDQYLSVRVGLTLNPLEPPVWIEFEGMSTTDMPSSLSVTLEAKAITGGLNQVIDMFNYDTLKYEQVGAQPVSTTDTVVNVDLAGDVSRFVDVDGTMKARVGWKAQGPIAVFPWHVSVDHVFWTITE